VPTETGQYDPCSKKRGSNARTRRVGVVYRKEPPAVFRDAAVFVGDVARDDDEIRIYVVYAIRHCSFGRKVISDVADDHNSLMPRR
jgi:hypothetical protein